MLLLLRCVFHFSGVFSLLRCVFHVLFTVQVLLLWRCAFYGFFTFQVCFSQMHNIHIHAPPNVCIDHHMHIHAPHACTIKGTYMCTTKYHQNTRYTQLAFPLYSMKHQVPNERSVLNQLFLVLFIVLFIVLFTFQVKTATVFTKTATFHENQNGFHCELLGYHQV